MSFLDDSMGALLLGLVFSGILNGVTNVQTFLFLRANRRDPLLHKIAVLALWALDAVHLGFLAHLVYHHLVTEHPFTPMTQLARSFAIQNLLVKITMPLTQTFYVLRTWQISRGYRRGMAICLGALILVNLAIGLFIAHAIFKYDNVMELAVDFKERWAVYAVMCSNSAADIAIAVSAVYLFQKAGLNLTWTDSSWTMLFAYFLNTGVVVSLFSMTVLIAFAVHPTRLTFTGLEVVSTRFYINSFLAMLNARYYLQKTSHRSGQSLFLKDNSFRIPDMHASGESVCETPAPEQKTINEVGLPLFRQDSGKRPEPENIKMLEVVIQQEQEQRMA